MEKIANWVDAFNNIARNENNFHSFLIERGENSLDATLTLEEVGHVGGCIGGAFVAATLTMREGKATLEMSTGSYRKCPTEAGYVADYAKTSVERLDLGGDPELISYVKSLKNEGDFIALLEAVIQSAASS